MKETRSLFLNAIKISVKQLEKNKRHPLQKVWYPVLNYFFRMKNLHGQDTYMLDIPLSS
jgi:hypothetical protein